jgi:hypothetical protein
VAMSSRSHISLYSRSVFIYRGASSKVDLTTSRREGSLHDDAEMRLHRKHQVTYGMGHGTGIFRRGGRRDERADKIMITALLWPLAPG